MLLIAAIIGALVFAAIYGTSSNNFTALEHIWSIAGPFVGGIVAYYFRRGPKDLG